MMRRLLALLVVLPLAALLAALGVPAAQAVPGEPVIEFSGDGRHWATEAPPLFDDALLVPGGELSARLFVRHDAAEAARLILRGAADADDPQGQELRRWLVVSVDGQQIHPHGEAPVAHDGPVVAAGEVAEVRLSVRLPADAPNLTRDQQAAVFSEISFAAVVDGDDGIAGTPVASGFLATTGAALTPPLLLAICLLTAGLVLRGRSRSGGKEAAGLGRDPEADSPIR